MYPRYRALAVAGLLASREWGWPIQTAHVVGWKGEGQAVSLQDGDEEWLQGLLDKTRSILEGGDPSLLQLEAPPCRSCYQLSCPKKAYLADLESSEELELINA
ncbi:MAG: hypothetical protein Q8P59_11320 [Dehalococcoidia bacterium]|nr:hypothetical protein [Dehalococcoidia bacterium]